MAKKNSKKKKKKSFGASNIIIPVAAVICVLGALGYVGKRSIEMSGSDKSVINTVMETPVPDNGNTDDTITADTQNNDTNNIEEAPPKNGETKKTEEKKEDKSTATDNKKENVKKNTATQTKEAQTTKSETKTSTQKTSKYASDASVKKLLQNAFKPLGTTMYIYGGGWNDADTGANESSVTIGVSSRWKSFYAKQDSTYNYKEYTERRDGLDCSGYVGWVLYNTLYNESGKSGFVMKAEAFDEKLSEMGLGKRTPKEEVTVRRPGDIMSSTSDAHVYIVVGSCNDGSVLLACSSPPGVRLCGTPASDGNTDSEAVILAEQFMNDHYGEWYAKYPDCSKGMSYLTNYDKFSPDTSGVIKDKEGLRNLNAAQVLAELFG